MAKRIRKSARLAIICAACVLAGVLPCFMASGSAKAQPATNEVLCIVGTLDSCEYTAVTTGTVTAKKGFVRYNQQVANTVIHTSAGCYARSETSSAFVKMSHEAYLSGGRVSHRTNGGEVRVAGADDYAAAYGVLPSAGLGSYTVTQDTIVSAELSREGGLEIYVIELDRVRSVEALARQMMRFASLKEPPELTANPRLRVVLSCGKPLYMDTEDRYTIKLGIIGKLSCTQTLHCDFAYTPATIDPAFLR